MSVLTIEAKDLGKEYYFQTVFQRLTFTFGLSRSIAVLGENGSGKSTLLRVISGMAEPTDGDVNWMKDGIRIPYHRWYQNLSFCSPDFYFDPRFTVLQILQQYENVKPFKKGMSSQDLITLMNFENHQEKFMNELSSGMNQRVRLVLSLCADVPVVFLDEPCSNLDEKGVRWYNELVDRYASEKLVIVASNDPREYGFCEQYLSVMDYK